MRTFKCATGSLLVLLTVGCSQSGGANAPSAKVIGTDLSGVYRLGGIECYTPSGALSAAALIAASSPTVNISVSGNAMTVVEATASCTITTTSTVVFTPNGDGYGTIDITGQRSTTSTGSSCTGTMSFASMTGGTITPSAVTSTTNHNDSPVDMRGTYLRNSSNGTVGIFSIFQVSGHPTDLCFSIYLKL